MTALKIRALLIDKVATDSALIILIANVLYIVYLRMIEVLLFKAILCYQHMVNITQTLNAKVC